MEDAFDGIVSGRFADLALKMTELGELFDKSKQQGARVVDAHQSVSLDDLHEETSDVQAMSRVADLNIVHLELLVRLSDILDETVDGALVELVRLGPAVEHRDSDNAVLFGRNLSNN